MARLKPTSTTCQRVKPVKRLTSSRMLKPEEHLLCILIRCDLYPTA
jgi:hypothetical protein